MFSFEKGKGAYFNGEKTAVSAARDLKNASIILHAGRKEHLWKWGGTFYTALLEKSQKVINLASSGLDIAFIGAARVEATIYGRISCFDVACAFGFLEEAGGVVVGADYKPLVLSFEPQKIIAANSLEILEELKAIDSTLN
jgi:myo-inositol-1(or 4)-monophosphatase